MRFDFYTKIKILLRIFVAFCKMFMQQHHSLFGSYGTQVVFKVLGVQFMNVKTAPPETARGL